MILLKWLWISLKTFTTPLYLINLSTGNCNGLTSTGAHYSAIVVFQFLGIGTIHRFDGVRATPKPIWNTMSSLLHEKDTKKPTHYASHLKYLNQLNCFLLIPYNV